MKKSIKVNKNEFIEDILSSMCDENVDMKIRNKVEVFVDSSKKVNVGNLIEELSSCIVLKFDKVVDILNVLYECDISEDDYVDIMRRYLESM